MNNFELPSSTWPERLFLNILSYSVVLLPIAFLVLAAKFKFCPKFIQSNTLVRLFVYGDDEKTKLQPSSSADDRLLIDRNTRSVSVTSESRSGTLNFLWCLVGLLVSYLIWGLLQEKIMTTEYPIAANKQDLGDKNFVETSSLKYLKFHDSQFLVLVNRVIAFIAAIVGLLYSRRMKRAKTGSNNRSYKSMAPLYEYIYCSLSNIISSWCQYEALKFVSFPSQCLSKSCKVIPVMVMSRILLNKRYPRIDQICAVLLALGMFIFLLYQPIKTPSMNITPGQDEAQYSSRTTLVSGAIILSLYLTSDAFTSNWQQNLYTKYDVSSWQMMAAVNFYSILLTLTSLHQLGNLGPAIDMLARCPPLLRDCMLMSITSSVGQMFVYYTIKCFGPVVFSVIMTLRQFISILLSYIIYGHALTFGSSFGLIVVFLVVIFQVWYKSKRKPTTDRSKTKSYVIGGEKSRNVCIQLNHLPASNI